MCYARRFKLWTMLFLLFFGFLYLAAQEKIDDISEVTLEDLLNTEVVSAGKTSQKLYEVPAKIVVVTAEQIKRRAYFDLEAVLHDLAGLDFNKGGGVEWSTIFMRGIRSDNSDRFLLIWDGVIQNDIWKQNTWISRQYPLNNIERIEVMYGPSSLLYGANAFSGIINVILKKEKDVDGISVEGMWGSFYTWMAEVNFGKEVKDWRFMANARIYRSEEMDINDKYWVDNAGRKRYYALKFPADFVGAGDSKYGLDVQNGQLYWNNGEARVPFDTAVKKKTDDWFIQAGIGYKGFNLRAFYWYRDENEDLWYTPQKRTNGVWTPTGLGATLSYDHAFSSKIQSRSYVMLRGSGLDADRSNDPSFKAYFTNNINDPKEFKVYKLGFTGFYKLWNTEWRVGEQLNISLKKADLVFGSEYTIVKNYEDYVIQLSKSAPWNYTPQHDERNFAVYGNCQYRFNQKFSVTSGLRYDYNYVHKEEGGFGSLLTSRFALVYSPSTNHVFKAIFGQAFQSPDSWHKFSTIAGERPLPSPSLKPEKLNSFEFCYVVLPTEKWENSFSIYSISVKDLIGIVNYDYQGLAMNRFDNVGTLKIVGAEFESRYYFSKENSLYLNMTYTDAKDNKTDRKTGDIAPFKANLGADLLFFKNLSISLRTHFVADRDTVTWDSNSIYSLKAVDSYFSADLTVAWLNVAKGVDIKLSVFNLTDAQYYDPGTRLPDGIKYNGAIIQEPLHAFIGITFKL